MKVSLSINPIRLSPTGASGADRVDCGRRQCQRNRFSLLRISLNPTINRGMIDWHTPFAHHLLKVTVADPIAAIPPHRPQNQFTLKMTPLEIAHRLDRLNANSLELGAVFLCADLGIVPEVEPRADHASYIASWVEVLSVGNEVTPSENIMTMEV